MTDLIERLLKLRIGLNTRAGMNDPETVYEHQVTLDMLETDIKAQAAQIAALEAKLRELCGKAPDHIEALTAQLARAKEGIQEIADEPTGWCVGPDENMEIVRNMARTLLAELNAT